jgi:hypothetical protein
MVKALAVVLTLPLLAACFEDRYRCTRDADCNLGPGARCELDGFCTTHDPSCDTERRYSEHSAELANACFAGQVAIANPCAGGQPAAIPEGCAKLVCAAIPACCEVGWSDACAQQAQLRCGGRCDTRIAVTASRNANIEHWELTWDGSAWTAMQRLDREGLIAWVGPAPGTIEPRLAGFGVGQTELLVGDRVLPAVPGRVYQSITSVDFDRDARDVLAVSYTEDRQSVQLIDVDSGETRDIFTDVGLRLAWGDSDRDSFPDGIAGRGAAYVLLRNVDTDVHVRSIEAVQTINFAGGATPSSPALRTFDWIDLSGDGRLDLVAFGSQIRVHADAGPLRDAPLIAIDCDPLKSAGCNMPESAETSFAGAAVPSLGPPTLVAAMFTDPARNLARKLFTISIDPGPPATFEAVPIADPCPTCPEIVAVIARDLDGDRTLDLIGLDSNLQIYTMLSGGPLVIDPFPGSTNGPFTNVLTSVTGAPIP